MKYKIILTAIAILYMAPTVAFAENGAKLAEPDSHVPAPGGMIEGTGLAEGFEDITTLPGAGWSLQNLSNPLGTTDWFQGNIVVFDAQAGPADSYIGANFNNTDGGTGVISNWLLTPEVTFTADDELRFWTRVPTGGSSFPDRLEVRVSTAGPSTDVGSDENSVGDFDTVLITINPSLSTSPGSCPPDAGGYPESWCEIVITDADGLPTTGSGRIGFRYHVTSAGPLGSNSNFIGIDTVSFGEPPEPPPPLGPDVVVGFTFEGTVAGVSGSLAWASDLLMDMTGPSGSNAVIGGFSSANDADWDFQGSGSTDDGTYSSDHSAFFLPDGTQAEGQWNFEFCNDFSTGPAATWTDTNVTLVLGDGSEVPLEVPEFTVAGGECTSFSFDVEGQGPEIPESQPVPVNSPWALALLVLLMAGLGVLVIRRMA